MKRGKSQREESVEEGVGRGRRGEETGMSGVGERDRDVDLLILLYQSTYILTFILFLILILLVILLLKGGE